MSCKSFEAQLEAYLADRLEPAERQAVDAHLTTCERCRDLTELARIAAGTAAAGVAPPPDLTERILARTAGPTCAAAEERLCDLIDDRLSAEDAVLVRGHLAACPACTSLAVAVEALSLELPRLADIRPDRDFVAEVVAASLPWRVRVHRRWRGVWSRWLRRPRFAMEAAYVATMLLVVVFTTPVSPLEAMPRRAVEIVRTVPQPPPGAAWPSVEKRIETVLDGIQGSAGVVAIIDSWRATFELGRRQLTRGRALADQAPGWAAERFRTFRDGLASLLESADGDPAAADSEPDEETS